MHKTTLLTCGFTLGVLSAGLPRCAAQNQAMPRKINTLIVEEAGKGARKQLRQTSNLAELFKATNNATGKKTFEFVVSEASELKPVDLLLKQIVMLCGVSKITEQQAEALENYVRDGGLLLVFPGNDFDPGTYNKYLYKAGLGLLPSEFGKVAPVRRGSLDSSDSPSKNLKNMKRDLVRVAVRRASPLTKPKSGGPGEVILKLSNGDVVMLAKPFGTGKCVQFACSMALDWSNFPLRKSALAAVISAAIDPVFNPKTHKRTLMAADASKSVIASINDKGQATWQLTGIRQLHDFQTLDNGNILLQGTWYDVAEVDRMAKSVWKFTTRDAEGPLRGSEIHAFQRLKDGNTMLVLSKPATILEVDGKGVIKKTIKLKVNKPDAHHGTRLARKLPSGNYLVCHEGDGAVREYDGSGKVVWEYEVPLFGKKPKAGHGVDAFGNQCFAALRLKNGNTLISTGNGHSVIEVTPEKKIVWKLEQNDLPGYQLAWTTTLQVLPGGNIVVGNCHAGEKNAQIIEVTRDKKVVWAFRNYTLFGNALTNSVILSMDGKTVVSGGP